LFKILRFLQKKKERKIKRENTLLYFRDPIRCSGQEQRLSLQLFFNSLYGYLPILRVSDEFFSSSSFDTMKTQLKVCDAYCVEVVLSFVFSKQCRRFLSRQIDNYGWYQCRLSPETKNERGKPRQITQHIKNNSCFK